MNTPSQVTVIVRFPECWNEKSSSNQPTPRTVCKYVHMQTLVHVHLYTFLETYTTLVESLGKTKTTCRNIFYNCHCDKDMRRVRTNHTTTHSVGFILFVWFVLFLNIFLMWTFFFLKSLLNLLQYYLWFLCFGFLAMRHVGSQLPDQGSNLHPLHWKVKS